MIIGHSRQLKYLDLVLKSGQVPHAFVFSGPEHIGKKLVAQAFIFRLNTPGASWGDFFKSENQLASSIASDSNLDVFVVRRLEEKKEISIAQIRELKSFIARTPFSLNTKGVIIDQAESLSDEAWVAILKTLEEPSSDTIIFIISSRLSLIPKTILSRSVSVSFQTLSQEKLKEYLAGENVKMKESNLVHLAGRPGLVRAGGVDVENLEGLAAAKSIGEKFDWVEKTVASKSIVEVLDNWLIRLHSSLGAGLPDETEIVRQMKAVNAAKKVIISTNANPRLVLENLVLRAWPKFSVRR